MAPKHVRQFQQIDLFFVIVLIEGDLQLLVGHLIDRLLFHLD